MADDVPFSAVFHSHSAQRSQLIDTPLVPLSDPLLERKRKALLPFLFVSVADNPPLTDRLSLAILKAWGRHPLDKVHRAALSDHCQEIGNDRVSFLLGTFSDDWFQTVQELFALQTRTQRRAWLKTFRRMLTMFTVISNVSEPADTDG